MRVQHCFTIAVTFAASACAPLESVRVQDEVVKSRTVTGKGHDPAVTVAAHADEGGGTLTVRSHEICDEHVEDLHHRTRFTERRSDPTATRALYGGGGLGTVLGAWVLLDAPKVPAAGDPNTVNPVGRSGAYAIGSGFLAVGLPLLGA